MTIKQALRIAMLELGYSEDQVDDMERSADLNYPQPPSDELPAHLERSFIESAKEMRLSLMVRQAVHDASLAAAGKFVGKN